MGLDIRPANEFSAGHLEGSVNDPLYQPIEGWSLQQTMRKATFAFFGIFNGTEANENFEQEVGALADPDDEVVLVCNTGGTLDKNQKSQARSQNSWGASWGDQGYIKIAPNQCGIL